MRGKTSKPYSSPELTLRFMLYAAKMGEPSYENPAISTISVVGGTFDRSGKLYPGDIETVERSIKTIKKAGITMSPLLDLKFYNLLAPINSDFMYAAIVDKAVKTDAVILCGLCGSRSERSTIMHFREEQRDVPYYDFREMYNDYTKGYFLNREVSISHIQLRPEGWTMAAEASGAKIVITRGGDHDEIHSGHFLHGTKFREAIGTKEDFEHVSCAIPGGLGIVINTDSVAELKGYANPKHLLGKRLLAMD